MTKKRSLITNTIVLNILSSFILMHPIEVWHLEELPLKKYEIVKKIAVQTVYKAQGFYLKIWNPCAMQFQYNRYDDFFNAAKEGIFDDISPLMAVVLNSSGICCGYATHICRQITVDVAEIRKKGLFGLKDNDSCMVAQLFARMRKKTLEKSFCFTDLASSNLGILQNKCYFIDLDGFWQLDLYKKTHERWKSSLFYLDDKFCDIKKSK